MQKLSDLISASRAVTVVGPGGIGKTVLASEVARRLFPSIECDVFWIELASLSDPDLVPSAVASVLGLRLGGDKISSVAVAQAISSKKLLLVLDNCEHVIDASAKLTETLLRLCPDTTVLATSREVLGIEGEFVYRVASLEVPSQRQEGSGDILAYSAVRLMIARTQSLQEDFVTHEGNLPAIAAICRRLDGIPLAIEFAASRVATLGVQQVAKRLDDRFLLLTNGRRTALPRHQTLRATLDWSYVLLSAAEKRLLQRLAVFPAGFTLDAAIAVMSGDDDTPQAVMDGVSNLVEKSLVAFDGSTSAQRWRLLETIRAYALEKLGKGEEATRAARVHAEFFCNFVTSVIPKSAADPTPEALTLCRREMDNVRAALDWLFSPAGDARIGVELTAAYATIWNHLELKAECRERVERALDSLEPHMKLSDQQRLQLYMAYAVSAVSTMGPVDRIEELTRAALSIAEGLGDNDTQLWAIWVLWQLGCYRSDIHAARTFVERIPAVASRMSNPFTLVMADRLMGISLHHAGEQRRAQDYLERVIERSASLAGQGSSIYPHSDRQIFAQAVLARTLVLQGLLEKATEQARSSLGRAMAAGNEFTVAYVLLFAICPVAILTGELRTAEQEIAKLVDIATTYNLAFWRSGGRCFEGKLLVQRHDFEAGVRLLRTELDACERTGWTHWYPEFLGALAEGLVGLQKFPEALVTIDRALQVAEKGGELYYCAELLRLKGEILLAQSKTEYIASSDECFQAALEVARQQGALLFELRAAMSIARIRMLQHRPADARQFLASVYDRFVEGFNSPDLRAADALLRAMDYSSR